MSRTFIFHPGSGTYLDMEECNVIVTDSKRTVLYVATGIQPTGVYPSDDGGGKWIAEKFRRSVDEGEFGEINATTAPDDTVSFSFAHRTDDGRAVWDAEVSWREDE